MKTQEALRAERLRRIEAAKKSVAPKAPAKHAVKATAAPAPKKPVVAAPAAPAVVKPEAITANVVDPALLPRSAHFEMSLYGKGTKNPHWLVVADGRPVAEIQFEDQNQEFVDIGLFQSESYGNTTVTALTQDEPAKILASLKARLYVATVAKSEAFEAVKKEVTASADAQIRVARSELRGSLMNVLGLVLAGQKKGFFGANDLKAEMFDQMASVGIDSRTAQHVIDTAWEKSAATYFEAAFKQAEELMDLSPEAYKQIEKHIDSMAAREPVAVAASLDIPSAAFNVPIETAQRTASVGHQAGTDFRSLISF